jgi:PAS domain S-box-containing protein
MLHESGFDFHLRRVENRREFLSELGKFKPSLILSDHGLPEFDGFTALALAKQNAPETPFIFVTGSLGEEMAIKAMKQGASDFVLKHRLSALPPAVHRALRLAGFRAHRRVAEAALQTSEERYRGLVELSPDALLVIHEERVMFINRAGRKLFAAQRAEDICGRSLRRLVHPAFWELFRTRMRKLSEGSGTLPFMEQKMVRLDGTVVDADVAASPLVFGGRIATQVVVHDVSERKQTEQRMLRVNEALEHRVAERTSELEAANKELEAFSYSVSHDLRAPLRHIEGFIEIIRSGRSRDLDPEVRKHLKTIADAASQMSRLIDDLLMFSRTARTELHKGKFSLRTIVTGVVQDLQQEQGNRKVDWSIGVLPVVECDCSLIRQVFFNLLQNALKYTRTRAQAHIQVLCRKTRTECIISVADNGVGFDMRFAHKLFGVFQRLHRLADFEGTGVGLANVRRNVHRHGGRTWAEGAVDKGATIYFTLPRRRSDSRRKKTEE